MSTIKWSIICALMSAGFALHAHAATYSSSEECPPRDIGCISERNVFQAAHAVGQALCGPEQAIPNEHIVGICDAACQQGAPVKVGTQSIDVCMNYSGPVTALVGIMTQDFSATQWLRADDYSLSDNFQIAMDGSQYLDCSNVEFSEAFRQGWVFWLVSPVSLAELDWQSGDYELLFNQIPEGCPSGGVEIQGKCVSCSDDCSSLFPGNISAVIECGAWQDEHCPPTLCPINLPDPNTGGLSGTWEGGMYPGHYIIFEVEDINGENYITFAEGSYVAIGCINDQYIWESNDLQIKIVNNECHIYFPDDINFGDGRGMELHIYFDSDTELHGAWVGETFCKPLIEGTLKAYHCIDKDNDGYDSCNECDDDNADINSGADEICDGVDNDCDGKIDEGLFYPDKDKDGYGDATAVGQSCPVPEGYVSGNIDCNDNDSSVKPGAVEIPGDGIDQNCDGEIDEASSSRPRFTDLSDGTVRDNDSGLIWLNDASCSELAGTNGLGQADWETAKDAAAVLESGICGITDGSSAGDWRLPTKDEWREFVDRGFVDPALCNEYGSAIWAEGDAFVGVPHELGMMGHTDYWSSTEADAHAAWVIQLLSGNVGKSYYNKGATYYVWPVRSDN